MTPVTILLLLGIKEDVTARNMVARISILNATRFIIYQWTHTRCFYFLNHYSKSRQKVTMLAHGIGTDSIVLSKSSFRGQLTPLLRLGAGACAGIIAMSATYPMDMVKGRITVQTEKSPLQYRGMFHALSIVLREEGLCALYEGWLPSVIGVMNVERR